MLEEKYPVRRPCSVSSEMSPMGRVGVRHLHKLLFEQKRLTEAWIERDQDAEERGRALSFSKSLRMRSRLLFFVYGKSRFNIRRISS
jgi:hypothetical protein